MNAPLLVAAEHLQEREGVCAKRKHAKALEREEGQAGGSGPGPELEHAEEQEQAQGAAVKTHSHPMRPPSEHAAAHVC